MKHGNSKVSAWKAIFGNVVVQNDSSWKMRSTIKNFIPYASLEYFSVLGFCDIINVYSVIMLAMNTMTSIVEYSLSSIRWGGGGVGVQIWHMARGPWKPKSGHDPNQRPAVHESQLFVKTRGCSLFCILSANYVLVVFSLFWVKEFVSFSRKLNYSVLSRKASVEARETVRWKK